MHIGRTHELNGDLDAAVAAALKAVRLKTTDDRRLFLARLRLRRGETELAAQGISHLRGETARAQGDVMLALQAMRYGDRVEAFNRLSGVRRRPWSAPAAVLAAQLAMAEGDRVAVVDLLERAAPALDAYWGQQARLLMAGLPRSRLISGVTAGLATSRTRRVDRDGVRWGSGPLSSPTRANLRTSVDGSLESLRHHQTFSKAWFRPGLAAELWEIGLEDEAGRWDPTGFPNTNAVGRARPPPDLWRSTSRGAQYGWPTGRGARQGPRFRCARSLWIFRRPPIPCPTVLRFRRRLRTGASIGSCWPRWRGRNRGGTRRLCRRWVREAWFN